MGVYRTSLAKPGLLINMRVWAVGAPVIKAFPCMDEDNRVFFSSLPQPFEIINKLIKPCHIALYHTQYNKGKTQCQVFYSCKIVLNPIS